MESGQLRKLNLCYAGIQSLYWAGFAAIWAFLSVLFYTVASATARSVRCLRWRC